MYCGKEAESGNGWRAGPVGRLRFHIAWSAAKIESRSECEGFDCALILLTE